MKVLLQIPLSPYSGYGNDGIGMTKALIRAGVDVHLDPREIQAPLPLEVASLLTKESRAPFDLVIQHVDPGAMRIRPDIKNSTSCMLGWTMWEYSNLLNAPGWDFYRDKWTNFDVMVGYDEVSASGLRDHFDGPVLKQQGGFEPEDWPYMERDWFSDDFYFSQIGVLTERKDPFVSIKAFSELISQDKKFGKHAKLMMKTSVPGLHSKMEDVYPGLRIFYDVWPVETVREFYRNSHVLLAPSRGEGKNMPALEMLSTGGSVIATNWGGHTEWMHPDYAYPLYYSLASVEGYPGTKNARASVDHMKDLMMHCFRNRDEVKRKGEIGSAVIPSMCSWDSVVTKLFEKLSTIPGGSELKMKFELAKAQAGRTNV
jgi:glycosyltransferase involved in cell wall biosynthesis